MTGQKSTVMNHMLKYGSISPIEAFEKYKITRLAAVVCDLRNSGVGIVTVMKYRYDADGKVASKWASYRLTRGYTT